MIRKIWIEVHPKFNDRPIAWSVKDGMRWQSPMFPNPVVVSEEGIVNACPSCGCDKVMVYRHVNEGKEDFNGLFDIICDLCKSETIARNINRVTEGPVGECC